MPLKSSSIRSAILRCPRQVRQRQLAQSLFTCPAKSPWFIPFRSYDSNFSRSVATSTSIPSSSESTSTRPPASSSSQSNSSGGLFLSPLFLQLLSGSFFLLVGFTLPMILTPNHPDTVLKPSIISLAEQKVRQPKYGTSSDYLKAIEELREIWKKKGREDGISTDESDLESHGISDWSYHDEKRPSVVIWAESTKDVQEIVIIAQKYKVPITPFSGGTSLEGNFSNVGHSQSQTYSRSNDLLLAIRGYIVRYVIDGSGTWCYYRRDGWDRLFGDKCGPVRYCKSGVVPQPGKSIPLHFPMHSSDMTFISA